MTIKMQGQGIKINRNDWSESQWELLLDCGLVEGMHAPSVIEGAIGMLEKRHELAAAEGSTIEAMICSDTADWLAVLLSTANQRQQQERG